MPSRPLAPVRPSRLLPALLAVGVHLLLAAFLIIGVRWQIRSEQPVSVELWNQAAAPQVAPMPVESPPIEEAPAPPPPLVPEQAPPARPEPLPAKPPSVVEPERSPSPPDIALERERRKRAEQEKRVQLEREKKLREEKAREDKLKEDRAREDKLRAQKARDDKARDDKVREEKAREQRQREDRERIDRQAQRELQEAQRRKLDQQLAAESAQVKADIARREAAQRARDGWIGRISGKIRGNLTMPENLVGNPQAVLDVVQLPTGEVISVTLRRSSGIRAYDEAVERAIYKSSPLPRPDRPEQFVRELTITHKAFED